MGLGLYFSLILLGISAAIVVGLVLDRKVSFLVMLYWITQVIRYLFEVFGNR